MNTFPVTYISKFRLFKEFRTISSEEQSLLIRNCIEKAQRKNESKPADTCRVEELFCEIESDIDCSRGDLEIGNDVVNFCISKGSSGNYQSLFKHYIKHIAMICQSHLNSAYFGYISRESNGTRSFFVYYSLHNASTVYQKISESFKKIVSTEESVDTGEFTYLSMFHRNNTGKSNGSSQLDTRSINSNISDFCAYRDHKKSKISSRNRAEGRSNAVYIEASSIESQTIDNTYKIDINKQIPKSEIIDYLKQKFHVLRINNSIFVNYKRSEGPYEDIK